MIDLKELRAGYGERAILRGADLRVAPREIVAVVGANGSGKTTLLDAAAGLLPVQGIRRVEGEVGRAFQDDALFPSLTVREALSAAGADAGTLARFGLEPYAGLFPHELSTGMRRVVEIVLATARQPAVLMLDEPSAGLARAEVVNLAEVIRRWRDETGGSVLLVEHDRALVDAVADRVVELRDGRLVSPGQSVTPRPGDAPETGPAPQMTPPAGPALKMAERAVALPAPRISAWRLARWGLREFAAGLLSVMIVGVLNRVMAIELGVPLVVVSVVVGAYNLAAPFAIPLGHRSDHRPLFGRRRSGYIVGGACLTGLAAMLAPDMAHLIARSGVAWWAVGAGVALFCVMGVGMYGSGTAFFALLADQCPAEERPRAAAIVYSQLMFGVLAGVGLTAIAVDDAGLAELRALFVVVGLGVAVLSALAVWGTEPRLDTGATPAASGDSEGPVGLRAAVAGLAARPEARGFFAFLFLATVALFLQQSILEPFGGEVLGLGVAQTTGFNGVLIVGVLVGMAAGSRGLAARAGTFGLAAAGMVVGAVGFGGLAIGAATASAEVVWLTLFGLGLGTGLFNVAGLSMMMGMSRPGAAGLAMGAWTLAHAMADGLATAGGGAAYDVARLLTGGSASGFAVVFAMEGLGLLALLPLLGRLRRNPAAADL